MTPEQTIRRVLVVREVPYADEVCGLILNRLECGGYFIVDAERLAAECKKIIDARSKNQNLAFGRVRSQNVYSQSEEVVLTIAFPRSALPEQSRDWPTGTIAVEWTPPAMSDLDLIRLTVLENFTVSPTRDKIIAALDRLEANQ